MILSKEINIKITRNTLNYYRSIGYDVKNNDIIKIPIEYLQKGSNIKIKVKCDVCGKEKLLSYINYNKNIKNSGYYSCSGKCQQEKTKKTMNDKYGVNYALQSENIRNKGKETCLIKYGTEHHNQSEIIKNKRKSNDLKKYGVNHSSKSENVKEKQKNTNISLYGVISTLQLNENKNKSKLTKKEKYGNEYYNNNEKSKITKKEKYGNEYYNNHQKSKITKKEKYGDEYFNNHEKYNNTCLEKYGVNNTFIKFNKKVKESKINNFIKKYKNSNDIEIISKNNNINIIKCNICNNNYEIDTNLLYCRLKYKTIPCTICNEINDSKSGLEIELLNFIKNVYDGEILDSNRDIIKPYELDIYLPEIGLAFEFNGLYWHSELYKDKNYHYNKTIICNKKNINLFHIFEDDWIYKKEIIKSMILNKIKKTPNRIFARKCEIKEIKDTKLSRDFLDNNHIQGFAGSTVKIGLFYNNELVSFMSFTRKGDIWELNRFCNKLFTNVVGGGSKILSYFMKNYGNNIYTFSDMSYSSGNFYEKIGFKIEKYIKPDYKYVIGNIRKHKFNFRKPKDIKKSEHELMLENNYYRIYNSGLIKYKYKN
ncbi:MAG: DUF7487 domain-containing protein [archaeon]